MNEEQQQRASSSQEAISSSSETPVAKPNTTITWPIAIITPYHYRWMIKARVISKSGVFNWAKENRKGQMFSVVLADESGEILVTAFNGQCEIFYDQLEINEIYFIKGCRVELVNKVFNRVKNDYEMFFTEKTQIHPCNEEGLSIPKVSFNFQPISALCNMPPEACADVIGICKSPSDVQNMVSLETQDIKKKVITLMDNTYKEVKLTLLGSHADKFDDSEFPVVAIKNARISDSFGGKTISLMFSSTLMINPNLPEAHELREWFNNIDGTQNFQNISFSFDSTNGMLSDIETKGLGREIWPDYLSCKAYLMLINRREILYQGCTNPRCNKKVIDLCSGLYMCEKCNELLPNFKWKLLLKAKIGDSTDHVWVTCFNEIAEKILGLTAEELARLKEEYQDEFESILENVSFQCFHFRLRMKMEIYNDVMRMKTTIMNVNSIDYVNYNQQLLKEITQAFD